MGICASSQYTSRGGGLNRTSTTKIIHLDGRLQEFRQPIKASHILSENPKCFLCSSESMYIGSHAPHMPEDEELQLNQIYFLMPLSKSQVPLSLKQLCVLAVKARAALAADHHLDMDMGYSSKKAVHFSGKNHYFIGLTGTRGCCRVLIKGFNMITAGMNSPVRRSGNQQRIQS